MRHRTTSGRSGRPIRKLIIVAAFAGLLTVAFAGTAAAASGSRAAPSPSPTAPTIVMTKTGPGGPHLANGTGRALYLFVPDSAGKSVCNGACAVAWPPYVTKGTPKAGAGVDATKLSTIKRDDGSTQVAYNGHPLYFFKGDQSAGTTAGQGLNAFGGLWWLVSPTGAAIKSTVTPTVPGSPSPHGGNGGGGGY